MRISKRRRQLLLVTISLAAAVAAWFSILHAAAPRCPQAALSIRDASAGADGRAASFAADASAAGTALHEPVRGAFVVLVGPGKGQELAESLGQLHDNVLQEHPRPVILFCGDDVDEAERRNTVAGLPAPLRALVEVVVVENFLQLPDHMRGVTVENEAGKTDHVWIDLYPGYQNMCRWNFMRLVQHPRIQALDYYCRLDTHSFVRSPLDYDVFDFMAARRLAYGFVAVEKEPAHVIKGLWDFTEAYFANASAADYPPASRAMAVRNGVPQRIPPPAQRDQMLYPYNNFEVLSVARFSAPDVRKFNAAVDASHNIYRHRWGDGPLRWIQCLLFLDVEKEVYQFTDFHYMHGLQYNKKIVCRDCPAAKVVG